MHSLPKLIFQASSGAYTTYSFQNHFENHSYSNFHIMHILFPNHLYQFLNIGFIFSNPKSYSFNFIFNYISQIHFSFVNNLEILTSQPIDDDNLILSSPTNQYNQNLYIHNNIYIKYNSKRYYVSLSYSSV